MGSNTLWEPMRENGHCATRTRSPIDEPLTELFARLARLGGMLSVVAGKISGAAQQLAKDIEAEPRGLIEGFGTLLSVNDISRYPPDLVRRGHVGAAFSVLDNSYVEAMREALARESAWAVGQAYEAFETFQKDTASLFLQGNPASASEIQISKFEKSTSADGLSRGNTSYWSAFVRKQYPGRELLLLMRRLAPLFKEWEQNNARKIDLCDWYEVVSEVRHAVTHSGQVIKPERWNRWPNKRKAVLHECFPGTELPRGYTLSIGVLHAHESMNRFAEYAFLVFKGLCIEACYDWRILDNLPHSSGAFPPGA